MPRFVSPTLEDLLPACKTDSAVDILLRGDAEPYLLAIQPLTIDALEYERGLIKVGEFKETYGQATNRFSVVLSNVNQEWGLKVADTARPLEFASVEIGRYYRHKTNDSINEFVKFFTGKLVGAQPNEVSLSFEVITPETAAGTCIAIETLSPTNGWRYPRTQSPPGSAGNMDGEGSGECPRLDQYVLVKDAKNQIKAKLVAEITNKDYLWNPVDGAFQKVKSAVIVSDSEVWKVKAKNGAVTVASNSHPLISSRDDCKGKRMSLQKQHNELMTVHLWRSDGRNVCSSEQSSVVSAESVGRADVMKIEMETGHIYASGASKDKMIVCHNAKNDGGGVQL